MFAEESVCWLCGEAVDMGLRGVYVVNPKTGKRALHPRAPVVDEIVPRSRGGSPYERSNCRLAHNRCNRYRSDRMDIEAVQAELRGLARPKPKPTASQRWGACPSRSPTEVSAAQSQNTPESEKQP